MEVETTIYGVLDMKKRTADKIMPEPEIRRNSLPREAQKLDITNVVDVPEELLAQVISRTKKATSAIKDTLLLHDIPVILSHDNATSYVEVAMRDGLGIDLDIDDDVLHAIAQLNKLSLLYQYVRMIKLPKAVRKLYIETLAELMAKESIEDMKKAVSSRKYSQRLRELTGIVKSRQQKEFDPDEFVNVQEERKKRSKTGLYRSREKPK